MYGTTIRHFFTKRLGSETVTRDNQEQLEKYYAFAAGESKSIDSRMMGHAGGNGVFNTLQISFIDIDFHMTIFTSVSNQQGEAVWRDFQDDVISLARQAAKRQSALDE